MGDNYGPMIVARGSKSREDLKGKTIAVPGTLTTAYLSAKLWLPDFEAVVAPFDQMLDIVEAGEFQGKKIDAGLVIHEGQLTYEDQNLHLVVDLGKWWMSETGLPLPLGCNGVRKDLGEETILDVNRILIRASSTDSITATRRSTMHCRGAEDWSDQRPIRSSECMSTTGRWISETEVAKRFAYC